jgi:hypothetical protein
MGCTPIFYVPAVYLLIGIKIYRINKLVVSGHPKQQTQQAF